MPQLEILPALLRFWKMILALAAFAGLAAFGLSYLQATRYQATAQLILSDPRNAGVFRDQTQIVIDPQRYVRNQAALATSTPALLRTSELIGGRLGPGDLAATVTAQSSRDLDLITITASDATPYGAKEIADAVGQAYQDLVHEGVQASASASITELEGARAELQARISQLETEIAAGGDSAALQAERDAAAAEVVSLNSRAKEIAVDAALYGSGVQVFEEAELPESPAQPRPVRNAALGGILGLVAACAFAWWLGQRHRIAESRHDPAPVLGSPLLGVVPDLELVGSDGKAPSLTQPGSVAAEAFRFVASSLMSAIKEQGASVVCVTSARQGDGKTVVALNVAAAAALGGRRVVLVDGDTRARGLSRWVRLNDAKGLTDLGTGAPPEDCLRRLEWGAGLLAMCPAGSPVDAGAGFFHSPGFRKAVAALRDQGDLIVIDAPPVLASADALAIVGKADGVIMVVEQRSPLHAIEDAGARVITVGTPVLGYVYNRARESRSQYGYGYGSRYGHGYGYGPSQHHESSTKRHES
jgi:Mrp family chromosome partitioning ATPase/capsular polysaccharide biosynthesis protein